MRRILKIGVVGLLGLILTVVAAGYWLLTTPAGTRWSVSILPQILPSLEIRYGSGTWFDGLVVTSLRYRAPVVDVSLVNLELKIKPSQLLGGRLALSSAEADRVELQLIRREPPPGDRPPLAERMPTVFLPLVLTADRLVVPHFELITAGGFSLVADIRTALRWQGTTILASDALLGWNDYTIETDLEIKLQGPYPVDADVYITAAGLPGMVSADLSGSLATLQARGDYQGDIPLRFVAEARVLDKYLPFSLHANTVPDTVLTLGPETLAIDDASLTLAGDLLQFDGDLEATLGQARYGAQRVRLPLSWADRSLKVADGHWRSEYGVISVNCDVHTRLSQWSCGGEIDELSVAPWTDAVAGFLSSPYRVGGSWSQQAPGFELNLPAIGGQLADRNLNGKLLVQRDDRQLWHLRQFYLESGDNRVSAEGSVGDEMALGLKLRAAKLNQLSAQAGGNLRGDLTVRGKSEAPVIAGGIQGARLRWGDVQVPELVGEWLLGDLGRERLWASLQLNGLRYAEQTLGQMNLALNGKLDKPGLSVDLSGGSQQLALRCTGQNDAHWVLRCNRLSGRLTLLDQSHRWAMRNPLRLEWQGDRGQLTVYPVCLDMRPASLCLESRLALREKAIEPVRLSLRRLPVAWGFGALPAAIEGIPGSYLEAELKLDSIEPLVADLVVGVDDLKWRWADQTGGDVLSLKEIEFRLGLQDQRAELEGSAYSSDLGALNLDLTVDEPGTTRALDGRLTIDGLRLPAFSWVSDTLQRLEGVVDGDLRVAGTADDPLLLGSVNVRDGLVQDLAIPYPLTHIAAAIQFKQDHADLRGQFRLNEGNGRLSGRLRWQRQHPKWRFDANLSTDTLKLQVLEGSLAAVASQLTLAVEPGLVDIGGKVVVEEADIRLQSLPLETISTSADAEIVGEEATNAWRIDTDLEIDLGKKLRFRGFGVDLNLEGGLRFSKSQQQHNQVKGEVNVSRGRFRAYGQDLNIRTGRLIFAGLANNPDLELEAVRESRDRETVAGLRVSGTLQEPVGEFFSEPSMTDTDVAYFILTGRQAPQNGSSKDVSSGGVLLNLGLARTNEEAAKLAERVGIKDFQISTADAEAGLETRFSGYLTPDLYISYGTVLAEQANTLTLQYFIRPNLMIEAISGFSSALDIIYSFRID